MDSSYLDKFAKQVKKNPIFKKIMNDKKFKTTLKNLKKCVSSKCYDFNKFRREEKAYKKALKKTFKQDNKKYADIFEEMKAYKAFQKKFNKTSKFPAKLIKQKKCIEKKCKEEERIYSEALIQALQTNITKK